MSKRAILIGGPKDGLTLVVNPLQDNVKIPAFKGLEGIDQLDEQSVGVGEMYTALYYPNANLQAKCRPGARLRFYHETSKKAFLPVPKKV